MSFYNINAVINRNICLYFWMFEWASVMPHVICSVQLTCGLRSAQSNFVYLVHSNSHFKISKIRTRCPIAALGNSEKGFIFPTRPIRRLAKDHLESHYKSFNVHHQWWEGEFKIVTQALLFFFHHFFLQHTKCKPQSLQQKPPRLKKKVSFNGHLKLATEVLTC